jgi:hypothetical protein
LTRSFGIKEEVEAVNLAENSIGAYRLMLAYELYTFDKTKGYELIGVLPERRKNPMRITKDSVLNWGKMLLGDNVDNKNIFFERVTIDSLTGKILWINPYFNHHSTILQ